jgi:hypothetical protein
MTELTQRILDKIRASLNADRLAGSIIYLDWNMVKAGQKLELGDALMEVPWDAYIAFVDLEPRANWGHECCYLAIRQDSDESIQVVAHMPPFLKAGTMVFRL